VTSFPLDCFPTLSPIDSGGAGETIPQQITMKKTYSPSHRITLHARCIIRNPSRASFYAHGIIREFKEASGFALCVVLSLFVFGISIVNLFFQH
jgi:hypothetical protein